MLRGHLSSSLWEIIQRLADWVERLPRWLRPAFFGAGFIYAFMIWRGALFVFPIAFVYLLFANPALLFRQMLPVLFIYAPGAGFLGGLLYGLTEPLMEPLGKVGRMIQFVLGTWVYCVILVFFIMPIIEPNEAAATSATANWIISAIMGLVFGVALGVGATSADRPPRHETSRGFVIGALAVGAALMVAMKVAGWW